MEHNILVLGSPGYGEVLGDLGQLNYKIEDFVLKPENFSLVFFTGGADVHPSFYGDTCDPKKPRCYTIIERDLKEAYIFNIAKSKNIKMAGVCRGLQFLNVMDGGKLIHHLDNHESVYHKFECVKDNKIRTVNSFHHQMIIPGPNCKIVGWSATKLSEKYIGNEDKDIVWEGPELEAAIYPESKACGVQWHPEWMGKADDGRLFFVNMVSNFLELSLDSFVSIYTKPKDEGIEVNAGIG